MEKIDSDDDNNCRFEFNFALRMKGSKNMVPVVMESVMLDPEQWTGKLSGYLGDTLYVNMSSDELIQENMERLVENILMRLTEQDVEFETKRLSVENRENSH